MNKFLSLLGEIIILFQKFQENCISNYYQNRFKECGKNVKIFSPIQIIKPEKIKVGNNVILFDSLRLNLMDNYPWRDDQKFDPELIIDDGAAIFRFCRITVTNKMYIGKDVMIADRCYIADSTHDYTPIDRSIEKNKLITFKKGVYIADEAWIGTHCTIIGNIRIGKHSIVGSNSVVTKNIPDYCVAVGAPAKIVKRYDPKSKNWRKTNSEGAFK